MNIHTGTVRQADTIRLFRKHLSDVGLESEQVFATILGPNDLVINNHEVRKYLQTSYSKRSKTFTILLIAILYPHEVSSLSSLDQRRMGRVFVEIIFLGSQTINQ